MFKNNWIEVSKSYGLPIMADGTAWYSLVTKEVGDVVCMSRFPMPNPKGPLDKPEYYDAQKRLAQTIADALNQVPEHYIDNILQAQARVTRLYIDAENKSSKEVE